MTNIGCTPESRAILEKKNSFGSFSHIISSLMMILCVLDVSPTLNCTISPITAL
ncbi:hypothetical protein GBAR_LOCUS3396 [Geodia barretti]|uniref:Uncharacterized protein n=1 Tax=Geodia barretti TaxID=519541 RepID=A0AA35R4Z1_GEOBA|nr:hypothetical protein GBAR_LOCUS3396 [Geodia barretti]